ncbi:MAG: hypothetical protein KTR26_05730 [Flammeovirgaceae bacterium]|nr:hypothetical protein [Flammeovirgaceae bacterium]
MRKINRQKTIQLKRKKYHVLFNRFVFFSTCILVIFCWIFNSINTINPSWFLPKEGFRMEVWDTLRVMKRYDGITCDRIGDGAEKPSQWDRYLWLNDNVTNEELFSMMDLDDGHLIGFGFIILLNREYKNITEVLRKPDQYDDKWITYFCGCTGKFYTVQDFLIENFLRKRVVNAQNILIQPNTEQLKIIEKYWDNTRIDKELNGLYFHKIGSY